MSTGTTNIQPGQVYNFYDSGGPDGNYSTSESYTRTFTAPAGKHVVAHFISGQVEGGSYDYINLYNGTGISGTQLGSYAGTISEGTFVSTGNSLTVYFQSDGSVQYSGWVAEVYVQEVPTYAWSTGSQEASITVAPAFTTTYSVDVTDPTGTCTVTLSKELIVLTAVEANVSPASICPGESATITVTNASIFTDHTPDKK